MGLKDWGYSENVFSGLLLVIDFLVISEGRFEACVKMAGLVFIPS